MVIAARRARISTIDGATAAEPPAAQAARDVSFSLSTTASAAFLRDAVERLGNPLKRERIGGGGALGGHRLDHGVGRFAHGIDQPRLFGRVLDPGAVVLGRSEEHT